MKVMLVDDDRESLACLSKALLLNDFEVVTFESPDEAVENFESGSFDAVVSDFHLPDTTGIDVMNAIRAKKPGIPFIIISGDPTPPLETQVLDAGASTFFKKPLTISDFISHLQKIVNGEA